MKELIKDLKNDLSRVSKQNNVISFIKFLLFNHSLKVCFYFRCTKYFENRNKILFYLFFFIYKRVQIKFGIQLPHKTIVGKGLQFSHFSGIVINSEAVIGQNFTIFQCVTVGSVRGKGFPVIGDNCVLFAGSKVIGNVKLGNNVIVAANAVVTRDFPDNSVVAGIPAEVINHNGKIISEQYRN
jgi:serine O-acetyltransferase